MNRFVLLLAAVAAVADAKVLHGTKQTALRMGNPDRAGCKLVKYNNIEAAWCDPEHKTGVAANTDAGWTTAMGAVETAAKGFYSDKPYTTGLLTGSKGSVDIVFSFGAADKPNDGGARKGFERIMKLTDKFADSKYCYGTGKATDIDDGAVQKDDDDQYMGARFYVDAKALKTLPGGWWKPSVGGSTEAAPGPYSLSLYWQEYYKEAMKEATVMVFLLTEGWFASKWCGEELTWATGTGPEKRTAAGKKNVVVLLDATAKESIVKDVGGENKSTKAKWAQILGLSGTPTNAELLAACVDKSETGSSVVDDARVTAIKTAIDAKLAATL